MDKKANLERRMFLRKVAYSAPAVVALGTLVSSTKSNAGTLTGGGSAGGSGGDKGSNSKLG